MFQSWKVRLKQKKQAKWQNNMRTKMIAVREKREDKLRKDMWAKWRQSYQSHISQNCYAKRLVLRFFNRWKVRLAEEDHLEVLADEFQDAVMAKLAEKYWSEWRQSSKIRDAERIVIEIVGLRVVGAVLNFWKKRM
jgi:protein SFI1